MDSTIVLQTPEADAAASESPRLHVVVIVLGDIGRSPRMQYHTSSLLQEGHVVSLIGYKGEALIPELEEAQHSDSSSAASRLQVIRFQVPKLPALLERSLIFYFCWRIAALTFYLAVALAQVSTPSGGRKSKKENNQTPSKIHHTFVHCVLVQNPPALPLLWVAHCYCRIQRWRQSRQDENTAKMLFPHAPALIIDWHNLGFSMLGKTGFLTRILHRYEKWMAPKAQGHLCVTQIMKDFLLEDMLSASRTDSDCNLNVLYDCPPPFFQPLSSPDVEHELMTRLHSQLCLASPKSWYDSLADFQTLFTERRPLATATKNENTSNESMYQARRGRPALIISSTSWTPDEDFNIFLEALLLLDERITMQQSALKVMVIVTGKGPQRSMYQQRISKLPFRHVAITTLWLEMKDYPTLIACADLTVSLHTSTSGLDLPMKLLDSFGCHVPALAYKYEALLVEPLLKHDLHGCLFEHHLELAEQLFWLLQPLAKAPYMQQSTPPHSFGELDRYSVALAKRQSDGKHGWHENWKEHALPVLLRAVSGKEIADQQDNIDKDRGTSTTEEAKKTK